MRPRSISDELKLMRILNARMKLDEKDKQNYLNLEKGLEGELKFDLLMENLAHERLILNDLFLEKNTTKFQIDSFHIANRTLYHFEIKNYEGDYYIEKDRFCTFSGKEILNPLHQLERSNILLQQLLQNFRNSFHLESYLIFINPSFTLYNAPKNPTIIFPTQLERFLWKMNRVSTSNLSTKHTKLAEQLLALHQVDDPYKRLPSYSFERLHKGMYCNSCYSFNTAIKERKLVCLECGANEDMTHALLRNIKEVILLFPELHICTNTMHNWCNMTISKKTIRKNLKLHYSSKGYGQWMYFE